MRFKLLFLLFISIPSFAKNLSCEVAQALTDPKLVQNEKFWHQLGELSNKGKYDDANITKLLAEHGIKVSEPKPLVHAKVGTTFLSPQSSYSVTSKAMKDVEKLPGHLREKYNQFLSELGSDATASIQSIRNNPGKWRLEKLEHFKDGWSVRLNGGYRVAFRMKDGLVEIFDVTKSTMH